MPRSDAAVPLIKRFEGLHLQVVIHDRPMVARYFCPAGIPTIGYGHVCRRDQQMITEPEAEDLLRGDMRLSERGVLAAVRRPLTDNQFSALVSFTFNVGIGAFRASTLRRKVGRGDIQGASEEFARWKYAGGRILAGLVLRRASERALFLS